LKKLSQIIFNRNKHPAQQYEPGVFCFSLYIFVEKKQYKSMMTFKLDIISSRGNILNV